MKKITLSTKEELNIYMSPIRQQLMHLLSVSNAPMTPKILSDKLQISASSVQHHIKKLMLLGVIELDHTETINGITASFYRPAQATVQIGLGGSNHEARQREVLTQDLVAQVYDGFRDHMKKQSDAVKERGPDELRKWGDILTGVVYLNRQESDELMEMISSYIERHSKKKAGLNPWEYAIIAFNAGGMDDD